MAEIALQGAHVLVTGASSGIGRAAALQAARAGARVTLTARRVAALDAVAEEIAAAGGAAATAAADLSDWAAASEMAATAIARFGPPHLILHAAGAGLWRPLAETPPEEIRRAIDAPYLAAAHVTRATLPAMLAAGRGQVAVVNSPGGRIAWPGACAYIAGRHALTGFARALAADLRGAPVGVSEITLGTVDSPYWEHNPGSRARLPRSLPLGMRPLSVAEAAEIALDAARRRRRHLARPWGVRLLLALGLDG